MSYVGSTADAVNNEDDPSGLNCVASANCYIGNIDARLIKLGYEPVACVGKQPVAVRWQQRPNTPEGIAAERAEHPRAGNTGLRTGRLVGVDIDLREPGHAEAIRKLAYDVLGVTDMVRIGSKGAMLCYRNETPIGKITISDMEAVGGRPRRRVLVEILGQGQEFVAYGTHPDTGKPFEWPYATMDAEPLWRPWADLVETTPEKLREFTRGAAALLTDLGYTDIKISDPATHRGARDAKRREDRRPVPKDYLIEMLARVPPECPRTEWIGAIGGIQATNLADLTEGDMDGELVEIAKAWSRGDYCGEGPANWAGDDDVEAAFWSLKPDREGGSTFGTLYHVAGKHGWKKPAPGSSDERGSAETFAEAIRTLPADTDVAEGGRAPGLTIVGQPLPASEDELATGFAKHMADRLRYVDGWGKWFAFDGQRWAPIPTPTVWNKVRDLTRPYILTLDPTKYSDATLRKLLGKATISNVEQLARGTLMETDAAFDADAWSLNTPAGIVDLRTGKLRRADPLAFCTKMTAVAPGGDCPLWRKFLGEVTDGNVELQAYLQRLAGYSLIGEVREHVLVFLYGTGGNGKGVFLGTLGALLGDYAAVAPIDTFTETRSERHPTDMAKLRGARLVTSQETDEGRAWAEAKIKALTGGDKIAARFMRQDFFEFTPQFTLLIAGNHKPKLHNVDEAMRRRLHMVPFTTTIGPEKRDPDLPNKLKAEWPGILQWAIEGCLEYQRIGLAAPAAVTKMTASYLEDQDPLGAWFEAWCIEGGDAWSSRADLYRNYAAYAHSSGEDVEKAAKFYSRLESRGLRQDRGPRPARVRGFVGVSLRPSSDTDIAY
jgi:P4 family phage/plasmid primase-like protien